MSLSGSWPCGCSSARHRFPIPGRALKTTIAPGSVSHCSAPPLAPPRFNVGCWGGRPPTFNIESRGARGERTSEKIILVLGAMVVFNARPGPPENTTGSELLCKSSCSRRPAAQDEVREAVRAIRDEIMTWQLRRRCGEVADFQPSE